MVERVRLGRDKRPVGRIVGGAVTVRDTVDGTAFMGRIVSVCVRVVGCHGVAVAVIERGGRNGPALVAEAGRRGPTILVTIDLRRIAFGQAGRGATRVGHTVVTEVGTAESVAAAIFRVGEAGPIKDVNATSVSRCEVRRYGVIPEIGWLGDDRRRTASRGAVIAG